MNFALANVWRARTLLAFLALAAIQLLGLRHAGGIPAFRQDWVWPTSPEVAVGRIHSLLSAWIPDGTGAPNATPTINPIRLLPDALSIIDPVFGFNATLTFIAVVTLAGLYVLARKLDCRPFAALASAAIYLSSELFVNKLAAGHDIYLLSAALTPGLAAAALWTADRPTWRRAALLGLLLFFSFAQLQFVVFSSLLTLGLLLGKPSVARLSAAFVAFGTALLLSLPTAASLVFAGPSDLGIQHSIPLYFASQSVPLSEAFIADGYIGGYSHTILSSLPAIVTWCTQLIALTGIAGLVLAARRMRAVAALLVVGLLGLCIALGVHGVFSSLFAIGYAAFQRMSFMRELYDGIVLYELAIAIGVGLALSRVKNAFLTAAVWFAILAASAPFWTGQALAFVPFVNPGEFRLRTPIRSGERILTLPGFTPQTFRGAGLGFPPPIGTPDRPDVAAGNPTPVTYAGIASANAPVDTQGSLLDRLGVTLIARDGEAAFAPGRVLRPGLRNRLHTSRSAPRRLSSRSQGVFSVSARPATPPIRTGRRAVPFTNWQSLPRDSGSIALDEPGMSALTNFIPHTDDPDEDWIDVRVAPWLDGARFIGPTFGIVTKRTGAAYPFDTQSQRGLLVLPPCGATVIADGKPFHLASRGWSFAWYELPHGRKRTLVTCGITAVSQESAASAMPVERFDDVRVSYNCRDLADCHGTLDRGGDHLVVFSQQYDAQIKMAMEDGSKAIHVRADGFANAWIVHSTGPSKFAIYYEPQRQVRLLELFSLAGYVIVLAAALPRRRTA